MYKRRDWLFTRGADGGGSDDSSSDESSSEAEDEHQQGEELQGKECRVLVAKRKVDYEAAITGTGCGGNRHAWQHQGELQVGSTLAACCPAFTPAGEEVAIELPADCLNPAPCLGLPAA